jgi:3-oxoacyl-[acyl-carrier protein] reductase
MRNVIVTGGTLGLGLGIARKLVQADYRVIVIARRRSEQFAAAAREDGDDGRLNFWPYDLSKVDRIPELVRSIKTSYGPLYGLVNNASIGASGVLAAMPISEIEHLIRVNVLSPIILTRQVVRAMMVTTGGRIINIGSIVGTTGFSGLSVYGATKAAQIGFTRSLARELGPLGITVTAIAPGFVDTSMTHGFGDEQRAQIVRRSALDRLAEIEDIANMVEFLMTEKARNITGTVMTVDAGSTA